MVQIHKKPMYLFRALIISGLFFISNQVNAQKFTADDLLYCIMADLNKFNNYVTSKGYAFKKS